MRVTHSPCTQNICKLPCKNTSYLSAIKLSKVGSGWEWQTLKLSHRMVTVSMRFSKHWPLQASWDVRASVLMMEPAQSPLFWIHIQAIIHASCSHASQFPISKSIPTSFWWSTRSFAKKDSPAQPCDFHSNLSFQFFQQRMYAFCYSLVQIYMSLCGPVKNNVHYIPLTEGLWNWNTTKERTI